MHKLIFIFILALLATPSISKEIIWRDGTVTSSTLKIITPVIGGGNLFTRSSLKLYVDVYDANFGKPKIPENFNPRSLFQVDARINGYLGTVRFDHAHDQKERIIHLESGKSYFFHVVFEQSEGSVHYTCHGVNKESPVISNNTEYVLYTNYRRLGIMSGVACNAELFTKNNFDLSRSVSKEKTYINELSRVELGILYGGTWIALAAGQRVVNNHDYETRYADAAANRLWTNFTTTDIAEVKTLNYMSRIIGETGSKKYKPFLENLLKKVENEGNKKLSRHIKSAIKNSSGESNSIFEPSTIKVLEGYTLENLNIEALNESIINGTALELQGAGMQLTLDGKIYNSTTLDLAALKFWNIYSSNDDQYVNAAIWLCRGLNRGNYSRYKTLFEQIMQKPIHKKLLNELQEGLKKNKYVETPQFNPNNKGDEV